MKYGLTPERTLNFLSRYMNEWIDAYPKKIKPFDNWIDQYVEKKKKVAEKEMLNKRKLFCRYCRRPFDEEIIKTKDHVVPLSRGGLNTKENRVPCCWDCNQWKKDFQLDKWLKDVKRVLKKGKVKLPYTEPVLAYMIHAINRQLNEAKRNQNKVSQYKV